MIQVGDLVRLTHRFGTHPQETRTYAVNAPNDYGVYIGAHNKVFEAGDILEVTSVVEETVRGELTGFHVVSVNTTKQLTFNIGLRDYELEVVYQV